MKVAIVAPLVSAIREPQQGGSQAFVAELARGLGDRGHDVHLYAASGSAVPGVDVVDTGVDARTLAATRYRASSAAARALTVADAAFASVYAAVRGRGYDVVHNHAFDAPAVTRAARLGAPVVHTLHLPPDDEVADALKDVVQRDPVPTIACVSTHQADAWRHLVPVDAVLAPLIPTGSIRFSAVAGDGAVFAGRLSPEKGAAEAIQIARTAGVRIDLFGDRYDDEYARAEVDPQRAPPGVEVHPAVPRTELWEVMARAAVVLCPAMWEEPFGMVAAEAHACGTPVVGFRRGALAEVVRDGLTGFLVAPGDIGAAADAVGRVGGLSRSDCREHAERHLDLEQSVEAHEQLYARLVAGSVGAAARG